MANLIRSAKPVSQWTVKDLDSYHISLNQVDPLSFFGLKELPQPLVDREFLNNVDASSVAQNRYTRMLINYIDLALIPQDGETYVAEFTVQLFIALKYAYADRAACTRMDFPLLICGKSKHAKTIVCLLDCLQKEFLLLVHEENMSELEHGEFTNGRAQLVAKAVAVFNKNNAQRDAAGRPRLREKVMPGIVMIGTSPSFFKIPITETLSTHIRDGTYPPEETHVTFCNPPVARPGSLYSEGMKPLDNRREILRCYEAFKAVVGI